MADDQHRKFVTLDFGYETAPGNFCFVTDFGRLHLSAFDLFCLINQEAKRRWEAGERLGNTNV